MTYTDVRIVRKRMGDLIIRLARVRDVSPTSFYDWLPWTCFGNITAVTVTEVVVVIMRRAVALETRHKMCRQPGGLAAHHRSAVAATVEMDDVVGGRDLVQQLLPSKRRGKKKRSGNNS